MSADTADRLTRYSAARDRGLKPAAAAAEAGIGPDDAAALAETARLALSAQAIVSKDRDRYREAHRHAHMDGQRAERARAVAWLFESQGSSFAAGLARLPLLGHVVPPEVGVLAYVADNTQEPA